MDRNDKQNFEHVQQQITNVEWFSPYKSNFSISCDAQQIDTYNYMYT